MTTDKGRAPPAVGPSSAPALVLVIDDDADVRASVQEGLQEAGYATVAVENGDAGLAYLRKNPRPAVILLDLFMPVMNGWQFVQRLRGTSFEGIPVVLLTASEPYWGYPVSRVLRKPLDMNEMLPLLAELASNLPD